MSRFDIPVTVEVTPFECGLIIGALTTSQTKFVEADEWETVDEIGSLLERFWQASGMPRPGVV